MSTGSREFDAAGDLLDWGTWGFTSGDATLACWVYFDSFPASVDARLISKADGTSAANHDWMLGYTYNSGSPKVRARLARTAGTVVGATTLQTGQWYHLAAVLSDTDGEMRVYVNGTEDGSVGNADSISSTSNAVYVGNQPTSATAAPRGRIADASVWSRVLSGTEIGQLDALTHRPDDFTTNLEGYLSGGDLTDSSGNGRDATNTNTTLESADPGFGGGATTPYYNNFLHSIIGQ